MDSFLSVTELLRITTSILLRKREVQRIRVLKLDEAFWIRTRRAILRPC
jgi:hypothetical protein